MIHTFHARIPFGNWILIVALLVLTIYFMWGASGFYIGLSLVLLMVVIERSIHTEYRLTPTELVVYKGKLVKNKVISMADIKRVERIRRIRIGNKALIDYLIIVYGDEKMLPIIPQNEEDFIRQLMKIKQA